MKSLIASVLLFFSVVSFVPQAWAIQNPLDHPNNKFGIHILDTSELPDAAKLVNSSGGDWGYVTIPIQAGDKDLTKWQTFMNQCKQYHLIPIMRLATEGDYFNTQVWRKPTVDDIADFANFLNSLDWPTENRYIIVFNEVNRSDEWGGSANPSEYATILSDAVSVFKAKNPDFFMISAGLDNAAPQEPDQYYNEYTFMREMDDAVPGIFNQVDGLASHSYPNPGFIQPPSTLTSTSIDSFKFERQQAESLSNGKQLPVFITETGWTDQGLSDTTRATYYQQAFTDVWSDPGIVAVTPFLLRAGGGPFDIFSFYTASGQETKQYDMLRDFTKTKGTPVLPTPTPDNVLGVQTEQKKVYTVKTFPKKPDTHHAVVQTLEKAFSWIMKL